jgi:hypothetical protein
MRFRRFGLQRVFDVSNLRDINVSHAAVEHRGTDANFFKSFLSAKRNEVNRDAEECGHVNPRT